jgi:4'-phosphopantetheinyl transferase EntD
MGEQNSVGRFENIDELPVLEFARSVTEACDIQRAVSVAGRWCAKQRVHEAVLLISIRYSQNVTGTASR